MRRFIAVLSASALLVVGSAFVVQAQTSGGILPCADLTDGSGIYTPPAQNNTLGLTAGKLTWDMELAGPSCPDVVYGLTVFLGGPSGGDAAPILGSASTPGDTISDILTFQLEINTSDGGTLCVVQTTVGSSTPPTPSNNGAAFDADGGGSTLLDRGPDGPAGGDVSAGGDIYCIPVDNTGSGGRTAG